MITLSKIKLEKHEEAVKNVISLYKLDKLVARVAVVFDISGSMTRLYQDSTVQNTLLRLYAVAKQFDNDKSLDSFMFSNESARLPAIDESNCDDYVKREILNKYSSSSYGYDRRQTPAGRIESEIAALKEEFKSKSKGGFFGFGKSKPSEEDERQFNAKLAELQQKLANASTNSMTIFQGNNEPVVMEDVVKKYTKEEPGTIPTYIIFISDGGVSRNSEIERIIRSSSNQPIFWQFVGLGRANYGTLKNLDTLSGRVVDNAGFFELDDINSITDEELYKRLLKELPQWSQDIKTKGIL